MLVAVTAGCARKAKNFACTPIIQVGSSSIRVAPHSDKDPSKFDY